VRNRERASSTTILLIARGTQPGTQNTLSRKSNYAGSITRPVDRQNDLDELLGLDFAARSDKAFQVLAGEGASLMLTPEELASPVEKCFPLTLDADPWTEDG